MCGEHRGKIDPGEHVAVEHHHGVVPQSRCDVGDTATGSQRPLLGDVFHVQPECGAVTEFSFESGCLIRGSEHDVVDPGLGDPGQQMGQERRPGGRQHRFGHRQRQRPQSGALAAHENDRVDGILSAGVHRFPLVGIRPLVGVRPRASIRRECRTAAWARTPSAALIVHRSGACHQRP